MGYLPVRLSTLKKQVELGFDLYLQLPHKTIKYIASDAAVEETQILNLKSKKVRKLYIIDEQEPQYQNYIDRCLSETMSDNSLSTEQKADVVVGASEASAERIMDDPHSQKSYSAAQNTASKLVEVLAGNNELLQGIFNHQIEEGDENNDARMHKHAVNTSSLSISFSEYLKLPKSTTENLGVAGLFHDIAYGQMSAEDKLLFFKPISDMNASELTIYKDHPKVAAEILQDKEFASKDVIELIIIHEERNGGNGYPNKVSKLEIQQEVLALCAYYDQRITCFNENRKDVISDLAISQLGNFELTTINEFKKFISKSGLKS